MKRAGGILLAALLLPAIASAHLRESDGAMTAVLHMDSAQAGIPTTINIEFNERSDRFALSDCECTLQITEATITTTVHLRPEYAKDEMHAAIPYTFAHDAPVLIRMHGVSRARRFDEFTVSFATTIGADMHDDDDQEMSDSIQNGMRDHDIIVGTIFAMGCIAYGGIVARGEYTRRKKR
jgi:hypothetical protein